MSELPRGWIETTIGDVCSYIQRGKSPKYTEHSDLPIINQKCVRWWGIDERHLKFVDPEQWPSWTEERFLAPGDVLWNSTGTGTIGRAALFRGLTSASRVVVDSHVTVLRPSGAVSGAFLHRFIQSPSVQDAIADMQSGTTNQVELNRTEIIENAFPLPPLAEQKRIVAKLDALNANSERARTELARNETLVSRYKQAVLNKAFSGELTREWRGGGEWPTPVRLEDVAVSFAYGSAAKSQKSGSVPVLRMGNIQDGKLDWTDLVYTDDKDEIEKYRLAPGDVLFNRTNSPALVGKTALYSGQREAIFAGYLIRIVAGPLLDHRYLTYVLNSPSGREFSWNAKTDGVSQSNISASKLKEFSFAVPPLEEQHEIVRRIESVFAKIDRMAAEAKRALEMVGRLEEAILAKAFRGELVPQDENDEPASSLLEKIRQARISEPARPKRKASATTGKVPNMARTILETLAEAKDWLAAQELFARCGVRDGSSTEDVEKLYRQLLDLERQEKVEIEEVADPATGAKQGDKVRLRK